MGNREDTGLRDGVGGREGRVMGSVRWIRIARGVGRRRERGWETNGKIKVGEVGRKEEGEGERCDRRRGDMSFTGEVG